MRAALAGDAGSFAAVIDRYRGSMRAVAVAHLGYRPDVDDVVQDATLIAMSRLGQLRDPAAVGSWLRA